MQDKNPVLRTNNLQASVYIFNVLRGGQLKLSSGILQISDQSFVIYFILFSRLDSATYIYQ